MNTPSIDSMLGIINNNSQTATLIDGQRNVGDNLKNTMERNLQSLSSLINLDSDRTINIMDRNNSYATQNLNAIGSSIKDTLQHGFTNELAAIERTAAANAIAIDRVGNGLSTSIDRNGALNANTTEKTAAANLIAAERIGGTLATLSERNNREIMNGFKETEITNERNFGETRLFNSTQHQQLERRIGDYYVQSEKNFGKVENDLSRVENSLGRLADNHHNANMIEMLKIHSSLDKAITNSEITLMKQASDNYANTQIEAAKNKSSLEQKMIELSNDIKLSLIKDNNDTRSLINSYNNDNIRNDLQSEKIIHALHHHGRHHRHDDYYDHYHHFRHHPHFQHNYYNYEGRGGGGDGGGGGRGGGRGD
jgi:hypothetical protein